MANKKNKIITPLFLVNMIAVLVVFIFSGILFYYFTVNAANSNALHRKCMRDGLRPLPGWPCCGRTNIYGVCGPI